MPNDFTIKRNDTRPIIEIALTRATVMAPGSIVQVPALLASQAAWPLIASQVKLLGKLTQPLSTFGGPMSIASALGGVVRYAWQAVDTDQEGIFQSECEVTYSDGGIETFPEDGYLSINIVADLG